MGIDIVGFDLSQNEKQMNSFLSLMQTNLHINEIRYLHVYSSVQKRLFLFYTFWTLKESYLKAIGVGIGDPDYSLQSLDFSHILFQNENYSIIKGYRNENPMEEWIFVTMPLLIAEIEETVNSSLVANILSFAIEDSEFCRKDALPNISFSDDGLSIGSCKICILERDCKELTN